MKSFAIGLVVLACAAVTIPALADPTPAAPAVPAAPATPAAATPAASTPAPVPTMTTREETIKGRLDKPNVLIELARPTPASAARDAHEQMRQAWLKKMTPPMTRAVR